MASDNQPYPLKFGVSADAVLVANTAATILTVGASDYSKGVRVVVTGGNVRLAIGRAAIATDPLLMTTTHIFLVVRPGDIVSAISTSTPTVNAALYTK